MTITIARRQFTVAEYHRMAEAGILDEDDRVELIAGEVVEMSPIGTRRAACVDRLNMFLNRQLGANTIVRVQSPIRLDQYSEPQPDITLLRLRADFYMYAHPTPADVLLVVEVMDSSMGYDREVKVPLYARAAIPEVWLVSLPDDTVEVYAQPLNDTYQTVQTVQRGQQLVSVTLPNITLPAEAVFG